MKKVLLSLAAALFVFAASSCSSGKKSEALDIIKNGTEEVNNAKNAQGVASCAMGTAAKLMELEKDMTDEEKKELEDDAERKKAAEEFEAACKKAAEKNL